MPRALEIQIDVGGVTRATEAVRGLAREVRNVGGGGGREVTVSGPAQRLRRAVAALENARASGDAARIFDAEAAISRATIGMQRARRQQALAGGGGFMDRLTGMIASTRFNAGPVSPLLGRTAELAGIPLTGATGLMIGGMGAALGGFTLAIQHATQTLNEFGETMRLTGGTARETAQMRRFGLNAQDAAGFRQRISSDPMAMMFAARLGVRALPRPFGQADEAGLIVRAARALEQITDQEQRLTIERELGLESVERYIQASPQLRAIMDQQAEFEERMGEGAKAANELSLATETLQRSWQDLTAVFASKAITELATQLESLALLFHGDVAGAWNVANGAAMQTKALEDNTKAHQDNTDAIKGAFLPPGTYGGGPRTGRAMPGGWSGDFLTRNMEAGALVRGMPGV